MLVTVLLWGWGSGLGGVGQMGQLDAINVTSESRCQAACLSGYTAGGWRCVTCYNLTHKNSFLSCTFTCKLSECIVRIAFHASTFSPSTVAVFTLAALSL